MLTPSDVRQVEIPASIQVGTGTTAEVSSDNINMEGDKEVQEMKTRVRRLLEEAPGKEEELAHEARADFWAGKTACWEMCHCPPSIKNDCPASKHTFLPCWEIEGTYCKLQKNGDIVTGTDTSICAVCRVYKKYGDGRAIELKLPGKGIDSATNLRQGKRS